MAFTDPDVCIYCSAPGCLTDDAEHGALCPMVTNLWTVTEADLRDHIMCPACLVPFQPGETYTTVPLDGEEPVPGVPALIVVCLGCAALDRKVHLLPGHPE